MTSLRPHRSASGNTRLLFFGLTAAVTLAVLVVSVTGGASAYYTAPGFGSGSAALGTLLPPTDVLVPATSAGTVSLRWTASVGTPAPTGYYATRTKTGTGTPTPACGTSPTIIVATAFCDDLLVLTGDYTYTVTAVYNGWTAASAPSDSVTISNPTKVAFQAQPSDATSGAVFTAQPSVAIQNAAGETVPTSTSPVTLAITGSPADARLTCPTNPLAAASGVAVFNGCAIDRAGTYTLTAASGALTAATSTALTVSVGSAKKLSFTQPAVDFSITGSTATISLGLTSPAGASLTCAANARTAVSGIAAFAGCQIDKAGSYTLTASSAGLADATSNGINVTAGPPERLAFTA
ncbi:hypothetical protein [Cryobacterium sp. Sr3]|uniref:hypothetical protein n=1 Tax=Cryobacterium sp. Sr3 TaxID=1259194 RepID=UPI00106C5616|nr:hypothetical protein [Cryobacterium sp. Sr3]TFB57148.1 hypothetical protein E3N94_06810 [Cryobacterium sp. Sr3]